MAKRPRSGNAFDQLKAAALAYPEAWEDHPWGETVIKVRGKIFLFLFESEEGLKISLKLPRSREFALEYPFTKPTGYGLGKPGWVTSSFAPKESRPSMCSRLGSTRATAPWRRRSWRRRCPLPTVTRLPGLDPGSGWPSASNCNNGSGPPSLTIACTLPGCANGRFAIHFAQPQKRTRRTVQSRHRLPAICVAEKYQTGSGFYRRARARSFAA